MNLQQFQALRAGDKIVNSMPGLGKSEGEVVVSEPRGVRVRWGEAAPNAPTFWYDVNGTAWFHWDRVEAPTGFDATNEEWNKQS